MKQHRASILAISALSAALLAGCGNPTPEAAVKPLDRAFANRGEGVSAEDGDRNKAMVEMAMAAARSNDLVTAASTLQALRSTRTMTVDQHMAVQDAMSSFQTSLAERAIRGDPAAQAALDSLRGSHMR